MIKIKKTVEMIPGGLMVVPLSLGSVIYTFSPGLLEIGGFTTALFKEGANTLIGAFLLCMGAGIAIRTTPRVLLKGTAITLSKFFVALVLGWGINYFFGSNGIWGLSALAVIAAMSNTNGGLYAALAGTYGDRSDIGAIAVISINDGPFLTMIAVGATGMANISLLNLVSVIAPILIGMILGNLDEDLRKFLVGGGPLLIPFFAFALGAGLDLENILKAGFPGVFLGVLTTFLGGSFNILADKWSGGTGVAGAAASSTAGNAVATPQAVVLADPSLAGVAALATPLVAASSITTAILTPLLTWMVFRKRKNGKPAEIDKRDEGKKNK
jgi:2-keto-3-deoxygluconate permease